MQFGLNVGARKYLHMGLAVAGLLLTQCRALENGNRSLADELKPIDYKGQIRVDLRTDALLIATTKDTASVVVCQSASPAECKAGAAGFQQGQKLNVARLKDVFRFAQVIAPAKDATLAIAAFDAGGKLTDSRLVRMDQVSAITTSAGTGGAAGEVRENFAAASRAQGEFRILAPSDYSPQNAYKVLAYFHGDTYSNYDLPFRSEAFRNFAKEQRLIIVSLRTPSNSQSWSRPDARAHAEYVHELLQKQVLGKYNIDLRHTYFVGQSGGGIFLAGTFIPQFGAQYRGGAFMHCGGVPPIANGFTASDSMKSTFRLHFEATTGDFLLRDVQRAKESYERLGMKTTSAFDKPGAHCNFDQHAVMMQHLPEMFKLNESA